jgi:divalent metal cation (Fe/Co/Zn/Cd) transporter
VIPALRALAEASGVAVHDLSARSEGDGVHLDMHMTVDGDMSLADAHAIADEIERRAQSEIAHLVEITTHIEPGSDGAGRDEMPTASSGEVVAAVREVLSASGDLSRCHSLRAYPVGQGWVVSLHMTLDGERPVREAHDASSRLEALLLDAVPRLERVIVHVEPVSSPG